MTQTLYLIVANTLIETGRVGWGFYFDSGAPYDDFYQLAGVFGVITVKDKSDNYIDPFRLARGEPNAIGPDGVMRWNVNVFSQESQGLLLSLGIDNLEGALPKLLEELPDCVLLTHQEALPPLRAAAEGMGINLGVFEYHGVLHTWK